MMELLTPSQMAEADRLTIAGGVPGIVLMENAGRAVADLLTQRAGHGAPRILVVAGPGNNGGDGFVAARLLAERGFPVQVLLLGALDRLKGDAAEAARRWSAPIEAASASELQHADIIVDALFGAGLDRPIEGQAADLIAAINAGSVPVVAVDLPSGIHGGTGEVLGTAIRAAETVTFFRRKLGHVLLPGREHCGPVAVADIGIPAAVLERVRPQTFVNGPAIWADAFPVPKASGHKFSRGYAVILSGPPASTGAARLAARGALRAGAGLVTVASPPGALVEHAAALEAIMVRAVDGPSGFSDLLEDRRVSAVVVGPGGGVGPGLRDHVLVALSGERAVVLDADALTSFAPNPETLFSAIKSRQSGVILTPHEGEFTRLFNKVHFTAEKTGKIAKARDASDHSGAVVILKGADTVVAEPGGRISVAENAPPWLATAGSGDVLAGMTAGLLAQGMPPFEAASAAVWLHGEAGNVAGPGLISEDLPDALRGVYRRLFTDLGV